MKVVTNISQFPEFGIDEAALKKAIVKRFHKIKKPIYIHIDKNLVLSHGHHLRDWITDLVKYPTCWTPEFISEIKKHGDLYHRVCLSIHLYIMLSIIVGKIEWKLRNGDSKSILILIR